jgi:threonine dehydratase
MIDQKKPTHVIAEDIIAASKRIAPYIKHTELYCIEENIYIKAEYEQYMKSFKVRGAANAVLRLSDSQKKNGLVTRSSGNFAQGLSYIAKELGLSATIVMPEHAPKTKVLATQSLGTTVILKGSQHAESQAVVDTLASEKGLTKMHPFDDKDVIAGQGTAMIEICEALNSIEYFFCPISGGGLMAGCATYLKSVHPNAVIVAVEPEGANDYFLSRQAGKAVRLDQCMSVADGLMAPSVGEFCRPLLDYYVDDVQVVSDDDILLAMKLLHKKNYLVEPSGAAAYAGYLSYKRRYNLENKITVVMGSGGNYDVV